jgi:hypothetical protein
MTHHVIMIENLNVNIVINDLCERRKNYDTNDRTRTIENINVEYATCAFYEPIIAKGMKKPTRILKGSNVTLATNRSDARMNTIDTASGKSAKPIRSRKKNVEAKTCTRCRKRA